MSTEPIFVKGSLSPQNVERARSVLRGLFRMFADIRIVGLDRLPEGGFIISPNHVSIFDAPLMLCELRGRAVTAFAADTYRPSFFFRNFTQMVDTIWVHRGAIAPTTLKAAVRTLRAGHILGVAPEGTRSPTHTLQPGKPGAVALAVAAGVPIVPAALINIEKLGASAKTRLWSPRLPVTVQFGEPMIIPPFERGERAEQLDAHTTELMCRIAAMLPARYHGVYADHPRLRELLAAAPAGRAT